MAETGSRPDYSQTFFKLFLIEEQAIRARDQSVQARAAASAQSLMKDALKAIGKSGDIDLILATERQFLENEVEKYASGGTAKGSLQEALDGLLVTEKLVAKVRDPQTYRAVDEAYTRPRSRVGGLPRDEARQFFGSHAARLVNLDKARMTPEERALIQQRKLNIRAAEKTYIALQEAALGRERPAPAKGPALER